MYMENSIDKLLEALAVTVLNTAVKFDLMKHKK